MRVKLRKSWLREEYWFSRGQIRIQLTISEDVFYATKKELWLRMEIIKKGVDLKFQTLKDINNTHHLRKYWYYFSIIFMKLTKMLLIGDIY